MPATQSSQPISDTLARALHLLRQDLYGYLDEDERFMDLDLWNDEDAAVAQELVTTVTYILRQVVAKHEHDQNGNCVECGQPWPCSLIDYVYSQLSDPNQPHVAVQRKLNGTE